MSLETVKDASSYLFDVGRCHDEIEKIYGSAMNFEENDKILRKLCERL